MSNGNVHHRGKFVSRNKLSNFKDFVFLFYLLLTDFLFVACVFAFFTGTFGGESLAFAALHCGVDFLNLFLDVVFRYFGCFPAVFVFLTFSAFASVFFISVGLNVFLLTVGIFSAFFIVVAGVVFVVAVFLFLFLFAVGLVAAVLRKLAVDVYLVAFASCTLSAVFAVLFGTVVGVNKFVNINFAENPRTGQYGAVGTENLFRQSRGFISGLFSGVL